MCVLPTEDSAVTVSEINRDHLDPLFFFGRVRPDGWMFRFIQTRPRSGFASGRTALNSRGAIWLLETYVF